MKSKLSTGSSRRARCEGHSIRVTFSTGGCFGNVAKEPSLDFGEVEPRVQTLWVTTERLDAAQPCALVREHVLEQPDGRTAFEAADLEEAKVRLAGKLAEIGVQWGMFAENPSTEKS